MLLKYEGSARYDHIHDHDIKREYKCSMDLSFNLITNGLHKDIN